MNTHAIEKEVKLNRLKDRLFNEGIKTYTNVQTPFPVTNRQVIREFVCGTLNITDAHTVNGWIDYLVTLGILEHNPTSQKTKHGHIKPDNDTRYYVHFERCRIPKIDHTHIASFNPQSNKVNSDTTDSSSF